MKYIRSLITSFAVMAAMSASAVTINFELYQTGNNNPDVASQFVMDLTGDEGNNTALFKLYNNGDIASTITTVHFYDGALLAIASLEESDGVDFSKTKPFHPDRLPSYPTASFGSTREKQGGVINGIDPGEYLGILFDLQPDQSFANLLIQLQNGTVYVGLHVQRIGDNGGSDWFISSIPGDSPPTTVPDGGMTVALLGLGMLALAGIRRTLARS